MQHFRKFVGAWYPLLLGLVTAWILNSAGPWLSTRFGHQERRGDVNVVKGNFAFFDAPPDDRGPEVQPVKDDEDYDPADYLLERIPAEYFARGAAVAPKVPQYVSEEYHIIGRKCLVAIFATSLNSLRSRAKYLSQVMADAPNIKTVIFTSVPSSDVGHLAIPNLVVFEPTHPTLKPKCFLLKVIRYLATSSQLKEYQSVFLIPDSTYVNPFFFRKLVNDDLTANHVIYVGDAIPSSSSFCNFKSGILLSYGIVAELEDHMDLCQRDCEDVSSSRNDDDAAGGDDDDEDWIVNESLSLGRCVKTSSHEICQRPSRRIVADVDVKSLNVMKKLHLDAVVAELAAVNGQVNQLESNIDDVTNSLSSLEQQSWPPGSNRPVQPEQRQMGEEWLRFNSTHFFPLGPENKGEQLPLHLRSDLRQVAEQSCGELANVDRGWLRYEPNRGIDYRMVCDNNLGHYHAVRELGAIPEFVAGRSKQEHGTVNVVMPVVVDGKKTPTAAIDATLRVLKQFLNYKSLPVSQQLTAINRDVHLHVCLCSSGKLASSSRLKLAVRSEMQKAGNVSSGAFVWEIRTSANATKTNLFFEVMDGLSNAAAAAAKTHGSGRKHKKALNETLWLYFSSPPAGDGYVRLDNFFVSPLFNRIRLNTILNVQTLCLMPYKGYHPGVMRYHNDNRDAKRKADPDDRLSYITVLGETGQFGSHQDRVLSFHHADLLTAMVRRQRIRSGEASLCEIFKPLFRVVEAPEPFVGIGFDNDGWSGMNWQRLELEDRVMVDEWAKSISLRKQKGEVLLSWMRHEKLDDDALKKLDML